MRHDSLLWMFFSKEWRDNRTKTHIHKVQVPCVKLLRLFKYQNLCFHTFLCFLKTAVEMTINASICDFLFSWIPRLCSFAFFWLFHLLTLKPFLFRLFSSLICLDGWSPEIIVSEIQFDSYLTTCHSDQISRYLTGTTPVFKLFLLNLLSIFFLSASLSERGLGVVNAL